MDRQIVYSGAIPLETDILNTNRNTLVALAKLSSALLGTATTVNGFSVAPTSPASMQIVVAPGEIYALSNLDGTAYSSLAADVSHQLVKQGLALDSQTFTLTVPATSGQSICYLLQATYQDVDGDSTVLPYYNSSNPAQAYSGPTNAGTAQNTVRQGVATLSFKAGVAATTGSQAVPVPDSGYVGLYVVTVAYGQTTITASNISQYTAAPLLPAGVVPAIQNGSLLFSKDVSTTANSYKVNLTPAVTSLMDGMAVAFQPANANTGAATLSLNGLAAYPIVGGAHQALQGGELVGRVQVMWHAALNSFVVLDSTGGAVQVTAGTASNHAVNVGQVNSLFASPPTIGSVTPSAANYTSIKIGGQTNTSPNLLEVVNSQAYGSIATAGIGLGGSDNGFVNSGQASSYRLNAVVSTNSQALNFDAFLRGSGWVNWMSLSNKNLAVQGNLNVAGTITALSAVRGDNSPQVATTSWVNARGVAYPTGGISLLSASQTLAATGANSLYQINASGLTITLPLVSSVPYGSTLRFRCLFAASFLGQQSDIIVDQANSSGSQSYTFAAGQIVEFVANQGPAWVVSLITAPPTQSGHVEFTSSATWTCPSGVTTAFVSGVGAGGGGIAISNGGRWGGGAGQSCIRKQFTVVPGTSYVVTIGAGVAGGQGGSTLFDSLLTLVGGWIGQGIGNNTFQGMGHSSPFGQGGNIGGGLPTGYGAGAGGVGTSGSAAAISGSGGYLLIEW